MAASELAKIAQTLVAEGKGILAADESTGTIEKRFKSIDVESTEETRRAYRELLFTTEGAAEYISGVILYDETIWQDAADGTPLPAFDLHSWRKRLSLMSQDVHLFNDTIAANIGYGRPDGRLAAPSPLVQAEAARDADAEVTMELEQIKGLIRDVPDFPKAGIVFKDITPILADGKLFRVAIDAFLERCRSR